ncbi:MAG: class 1 fructose-bisphosphatase [Ignavibacteriae bacterium]|nr:class 1 fructose-bisphosphatase [Ignavibacteriota bacterium]
MALISTSKLITIDRYFAEEEYLHPHATGEFTSLMHDLILAIRIIAIEVRRAGINDIMGITDFVNINGDKVRKLDEYANEVIYRSMVRCGKICAIVSEEFGDVIKIPSDYKKGKYILAYDPIDGSTNIDVGISIGTIFSLYKRLDPYSIEEPGLDDILQPGYKLEAAGYVHYGSSTMLVYTTGNGVNVFTYDPTIGEFILTFEKLKIPKQGNLYSCNESNYFNWDEKVRQYIDYLKRKTESGKEPYTLRYVATAVADIHRALHYGGIYMYPATVTQPNGKIRLLYEANPLAMIIEQAGGRATTGTQRILDVQPYSIHQPVPFFVGSEDDVLEAEMFIRGEHPAQK